MARSEGTPVVEVLLDRPRRLAFTLGAMRRLREKLGEAGEIDVTDRATMLDRLAIYVWACLVREDREGLSPEDIEDMIPYGNIPAVGDSIKRMVDASMPEASEGKAAGAAKRPKKKSRR